MCVCVCVHEVFTVETDTIPRSWFILDLFFVFSTTGVCCVYGRWSPLCSPQNTKRARHFFSPPGDFVSVWSGRVRFGLNSGEEGRHRTQALMGHGLTSLLSHMTRCFVSRSHATELPYYPGDDVTRAGGSSQMKLLSHLPVSRS